MPFEAHLIVIAAATMIGVAIILGADQIAREFRSKVPALQGARVIASGLANGRYLLDDQSTSTTMEFFIPRVLYVDVDKDRGVPTLFVHGRFPHIKPGTPLGIIAFE